MKLYEASYGLHLGNSAVDQQKFLSQDPAQRAEVEVTCELWFSDAIQVAKLNHKALKFAEYPITLATITKRLQSLEIGAPGTSR
ncbi:MAG: hypothetical protein F6J95_027075 [Leptolyngbya sp. SIO1E4]|nr:hypothetical protein [Leptolyngbya sp. SIO1E4]